MKIILGSFEFAYSSPSVHGMGLSSSSNFAVLFEATQLFLRTGSLPDAATVADAALRFERRIIDSPLIAADDVYPISHGGVVIIETEPHSLAADGSAGVAPVHVRKVPHDPLWLHDHVVVAFDPVGTRHYAPDLLKQLFSHPRARAFVQRFSEYADAASSAITLQDPGALASAINAYRLDFDDWSSGEYCKGVIHDVALVADHVLGWKPPGGGGSKSLLLITEGREQCQRVSRILQNTGWWCTPVGVTHGIAFELDQLNGGRITAGHRIDFVGAADFGQDPRIAVRGRCCSCAIEPRAEVVVRVVAPRKEME